MMGKYGIMRHAGAFAEQLCVVPGPLAAALALAGLVGLFGDREDCRGCHAGQ